MKFISILIFVLLSIFCKAQIIITQQDMPVVNDSVKISTADNGDIYDYTLTGENYNWDFTDLTAGSYAYSNYINVSETGILYQFTFNPLVSNIASAQNGSNIIGIDLSAFGVNFLNGYDFYNKTNSSYSQVGFGIEFNALPIPVKYNSPDVIYKFPLTYKSTYNSFSSYQLNLSGIGYLSQERKRTNVVDGWGYVTTPFGTFECIRLKSSVQQKDSVYISQLPIPFPAIPSAYTEYTWLSKDEKLPILKVVDNGLTGITVTYIDSSNYFNELGKAKDSLQIRIYPNPSHHMLVVETNQDSFDIDLIDINGRIVWSKSEYSNHKTLINVELLNAGIYFIRLKSPHFSKTTKIIIH